MLTATVVTCVEIMLQAPSASSKNHMTHTVAGVKRLVLETTDGRDAGPGNRGWRR